uniref:Uncharacterized protein n=1 Tax=Arundo donax TaxID=35708 RepID=A0A0A8XUI6_ARUDO
MNMGGKFHRIYEQSKTRQYKTPRYHLEPNWTPSGNPKFAFFFFLVVVTLPNYYHI